MKRPVLWLAVLCHLGLTIGYLVSTPAFEAPDENSHFLYAAHLSGARSLPILKGTAERLGRSWMDEQIQAYHPPLYYALLAATMTAAGHRDTVCSAFAHQDPRRKDPAFEGRFLAKVHGADEQSPVSPEIRLFRLLRGWSVLFGLITILLIHRLGRIAFPESPAVADLAALLVACLPKWNFVLGALNNGNLATVLAHAALVLLALGLAPRRLTLPLGARLGLFVGLALIAKLTAVFLLPLAALVYLRGWWTQREQRPAVVLSAAVFGVTTLALSGWFFLRNWRLYGGPLALDAHQSSFQGVRIPEGESWAWLRDHFFPDFFGTLLGRLGWNALPTAPWLLGLGQLLVLLAVLGLLLRFLRRDRVAGNAPVIVLLSLAALLVFGLTVNYNTMMRGAHGRYMFPVIGAFSVLFAAGLVTLLEALPRRVRRWLLPVLCLVPPVVGSVVLFHQFRPAFRPELAPGPEFYASLTEKVATEPEHPSILLLEPADGALLDRPPLLRWSAPVAAGEAPLYTLHLYDEHGRVLIATFEQYNQGVRGNSWQVPEVAWEQVIPRGRPVRWKVRQVPDRSLGQQVGETPESGAFRFTRRR